MTDMANMGSFLADSDTRMITVQGAGIEVYEMDLVQDLSQNIANAGTYQLAIGVAQSGSRVRIDVDHIAPGVSVELDGKGTVVCDHVVEFYDTLVTINGGAVGTQGQFVLPDGPGRYRVVVTTDIDGRAEIARAEQQIFDEHGTDLATIRTRLSELDGAEWYHLFLRYEEPIPDGDDDDDEDD